MLAKIPNLENRIFRWLKEEFGISYPGFTKININGQPRFVKGHNEYGSLLNDLAAALSSFNPNISDSDAMALSKVGVVNDFSEAEKNKVIKHREGKRWNNI